MSPPRMLAGGIALAVVALLATAAPASAHDELISSDPAADAVLETAPTRIALTYSADLLDVGAAVIVAGADGDDHAVTEPAIDGDVVSVDVDPELPDGGYEVRWRVVSSDGHPISGVIPFVVGDGAPLASDAGANDDDASGEASAGSSSPTTVTDAAAPSPSTDDGTGRTVLVATGGALLALALFALITFLRRRRTAAGPDDAQASSMTDKDQP